MQRSVMTTMLRLKNVKIGSKYAEADFYPEDSGRAGHVVDLSSGEVASCNEVPGYGEMYCAHVRQCLVKMAKENDSRSERLVMWY